MTTVAVLADPPRPGLVHERLVETTPLTAAEAADLYTAGFRDVCRAAATSGGDLLVNYRADEDLPDGGGDADGDEGDSEAELRAALEAVDEVDAGDVRFEVQVGGTFAGRVGNTATHLLENEGVTSVAIATPSAVLLTRQRIDQAAMKLRRREVVLGPAPGGRVYYAGLREPIDFEDAYAPPALETLTGRGVDAGLDVDYVATAPVLETAADLGDLVTLVRARRAAGRNLPVHTAEALATLDLRVRTDGDGLRAVRAEPDR
jgi:glycosyltransferase A (GT-A) superfamily protein (DUF2064 family)